MTLRTHHPLLSIVLLAALVGGGCETSSTTETVAVSPSSAKCEIALTAPSLMDAAGGAGTLRITAQPECSWNASSTATWISVSPASGQGAADLAFRVASNEGTAARDGEIAVNEARARVSQRAPCRYDVSPASQNMAVAGGTASVSVTTTSDCSWTASSEVGWITVSQPASGVGNGTVRFTVAANSDGARTGTIAIANTGASVTQAGVSTPGCTYSIAPANQSIAAAGGAGSTVAVTTQAACSWTAVSNASWLTVTSGASGAGNGSVRFTVAVNTGAARTGTLTIAGNTFTVSQAGASAPPPPPPSCTYSVPSKVDIGSNGGTKNFNVSTSSGCAWTATSNTSWIVITAGASGSGNGTVTILVAPNLAKQDRQGSLTVAGKSVTVEQKGS